MDRPDLRDDYKTRGWQVLDAMPCEVGDLISNTMVTGPACVRIKRISPLAKNMSSMN